MQLWLGLARAVPPRGSCFGSPPARNSFLRLTSSCVSITFFPSGVVTPLSKKDSFKEHLKKTEELLKQSWQPIKEGPHLPWETELKLFLFFFSGA